MGKSTKTRFKRHTPRAASVPESFDSDSDKEIIAARCNEIEAALSKLVLSNEDAVYQVGITDERLQEIQDNTKHVVQPQIAVKFANLFKKCRVQFIRVEKVYTGKKVMWDKQDDDDEWMYFENMSEALSLLDFEAITSDSEYHYYYQRLMVGQDKSNQKKKRNDNYPIAKRSGDGQEFCIRLVGNEKVNLPIVARELVEKLEILDENYNFLKLTHTRKLSVEYMVEKSGDLYDYDVLWVKLRDKMRGAPGRNRASTKTKFEDTLFPADGFANGRMQFRLRIPAAQPDHAIDSKLQVAKPDPAVFDSKLQVAKPDHAIDSKLQVAKPDPAVFDSKLQVAKPDHAIDSKLQVAKPDSKLQVAKPDPAVLVSKLQVAKPDPAVLDSNPKKASSKEANPSPQPLAELDVNTSTTNFHPILGKVTPGTKDVSKQNPTAKKVKKAKKVQKPIMSYLEKDVSKQNPTAKKVKKAKKVQKPIMSYFEKKP
ncbi:hypothetical protein CTEN210_13141 [Chaetoceros tenuissimus]|uniref:Uncharacterized protein n=1 Tax=Chaetoceros tenuissimus TaxID=426638 RepID=A0AAD3D509_9STRA|nr:hypothetical protein CTEN210_13141 [Chaetoceros tenuissimus]